MTARSTTGAVAHLGRDRRAALRPGLPARLPPDRQPPRRRGPHAGGLRPGLPVAVAYTPGHLRGLAAPDHHQPLPRPGPPQAADPLRRARRRRAQTGSPSAAADARRRRTPTGLSTTTSSARSPTLPPDFRAAVVLCDVEGLTYEEIADVLGLKLGTVRSRIHRGRAMLRKALAHRAPAAGRARYSGPPSRVDGGSRRRPRDGATPAARRPPRLLGQRAARRPARPHEEPSAPGSTSTAARPAARLVEREGWVKRQLAQIAVARADAPPTGSSARCSSSTRTAAAWADTHDDRAQRPRPSPRRHRPRRRRLGVGGGLRAARR